MPGDHQEPDRAAGIPNRIDDVALAFPVAGQEGRDIDCGDVQRLSCVMTSSSYPAAFDKLASTRRS